MKEHRLIPIISIRKKVGIGFALGFLTAAYLLHSWQGVLRIGLLAALVVGIGYLLWLRGLKVKDKLKGIVNKPFTPKGKWAAAGVGTLTILGVYTLLGGNDQAYAVMAEEGLLDPDTAGYKDIPIDLTADLAGEEGEVILADLASEEGEVLEKEQSFQAVPLFVLVGGIRSLVKHGKQYLAGELRLGEGIRNTGVDVLCATGRGVVFSTGARLAGMVVATSTGAYPIVVASGVLCTLISEPVINRFGRFLKGREPDMAQANVAEKLEKLGRRFAEGDYLARAYENIDQLVVLVERDFRELNVKKSLGWQEVFFPTMKHVLEAEFYESKNAERINTERHCRTLKEKLTDALISRKFQALGELIYFNRTFILKGYQDKLQHHIDQLEKAISRLEREEMPVAR